MYTPGLLSLKKSNVDVVGFDPRLPLMAVVEGAASLSMAYQIDCETRHRER